MSLFADIQELLERTYGRTGVNFEEFLVGRERSRDLARLAGPTADQVSDLGRLFLRRDGDQLRLGIYYHPSVVAALEARPPYEGLTDDNILPFLVLIEELDHALHAALKFRAGQTDIHQEDFVRDLELQAKIDAFLILARFASPGADECQLTAADRRWLMACLFDAQTFAYAEPRLRDRYRETNRLARRYLRHLARLTPRRRTTEIRRFRRLPYARKSQRIAALGV
jgi:hypothetical protein